MALRLITVRHTWGVDEAWETVFPKFKKEGFDAVEIPLAFVRDYGVEKFQHLLKENDLQYVAMIFTDGPLAYSQKANNSNNDFLSVKQHITEFENQLRDVAELHPLFVNTHSGKDWFSIEEAVEFFEAAIHASKEAGIRVCHETHRGRILYSPWVARAIVAKVPDLLLCADLSHFVVVTEANPADQKLTEAINALADRVIHIHARVGYEEGPQVNDPRAPEWEDHVRGHEKWWETIWRSQAERKLEYSTFTPEFGPPQYMHTLPFSKVPVSNLWEICKHMRDREVAVFNKLFEK